MTKIDITSTAIEKSIDLVKGFLEKISGAAIEETGLMIADNVKLRRFKNQLKIFSKAQKIAEAHGINTKTLSLKTLVPLIEFASLEDDETLQDKWTNLIVNFIDSDKKYESAIFPFILSQLTSEEVIELDNLYSGSFYTYAGHRIDGISRANFIRLGLFESQQKELPKGTFMRRYELLKGNNSVVLTELGVKFIECCSRKITDL